MAWEAKPKTECSFLRSLPGALGCAVRIHFPISFASQVTLGCSNDQWNVGQSDVLSHRTDMCVVLQSLSSLLQLKEENPRFRESRASSRV